MKRQEGFGALVYLALILAILGILTGVAAAIYEAGKDSERSEQAERDRQAQADLEKLRAWRRDRWRQASAKYQQTENNFIYYYREWQEAKDAAEKAQQSLAHCRTVPATATTPERSDVLLTYGFLRLYDGAWINSATGQPLFGNPARPSETAPPAGAPSARGLDDLLRAHKENASECSLTSARYNELITAVEELRKRKWECR